MQEVAEPLMDLKDGIAELQQNKTFRIILSALLATGNFLNGSHVRILIHIISLTCLVTRFHPSWLSEDSERYNFHYVI